VSAAEAFLQTITIAGALPVPTRERSPGGDAGAVVPGLSAEFPQSDGRDQFVVAAPGGDLAQTDDWAKTRCSLGLETCRAVMRQGERIPGGAQIVLKRFGPLGAVGYIARGPLIADDVCHWHAIRWAKYAGYRYYDLGGIDHHAAELLANRQRIPEVFLRSPAAFEIGFGGQPFPFPKGLAPYFRSPRPSRAQDAYARLGGSGLLRTFINRFRNG
jgi:hypothetical protein